MRLLRNREPGPSRAAGAKCSTRSKLQQSETTKRNFIDCALRTKVKTPTFSNEFISSMLGVVRVHADSEYCIAEYAILVRSDLKGHGLGWLLMELMIE
jgi:hypothetical protein